MEILSPALVREWCRLDDGVDDATLVLLESSAIDVIEHDLGVPVRPHTDATGAHVVPIIPLSVQHAIAVFIGAHFNEREGSTEDAMRAIRNLCAPHRRVPL